METSRNLFYLFRSSSRTVSSTLYLGIQWGGGGGGKRSQQEINNIINISHKDRGRYLPGDLVLYPGDREI